jgi:putative CocE/NonD family hydrolase
MSLETPFGWGVLIGSQERPFALLRQVFQRRRVGLGLRTLPLRDGDVVALGNHSQYVQDVLTRDSEDSHWESVNHAHRVANVTVPVSSIGGWYDIFLVGQLRDFRALISAGKSARLTIGPWTHVSMTNVPVLEALEFGLAYARNQQPSPRAAVRLFVMGAEVWRDFATWPPEGYSPQRFHLHGNGLLSSEPPDEAAPDGYRYDPADPTPAVGGVRMPPDAGRVDNARLEARDDVLKYTTAPLEHDVEVVGEVEAQIWFRSSLPYADVFVRLCDVDERGRSFNVCDGLVSLTGADALQRVTVVLWPTAHCFNRGHRIRVQVSSGAFPRYARNYGTGEPRATATRLIAANQAVYHGPDHPSAIILPVRR